MICKKCSCSFDDSLPFCTNCGEKVENSETQTKFKVSISDEKFDELSADVEISPEAAEDTVEKLDSSETAATDEGEEKATAEGTEELNEEEKSEDETASQTQQDSEEPKENADEAENEDALKTVVHPNKGSAKQPVRENVKIKPISKKTEVKNIKAEKKAYNTVLTIVSVMAFLLCVLTALGLGTDVFEQEDSLTAVGISVLTSNEQQLLQDSVSKLYTVMKASEYEQGKVSAEDILHSFNVGSDNGIFAFLGGKAEHITDENDPAIRFKRQQDDTATQYGSTTVSASEETLGDYDYYKVSKEQIGEMFVSLGVKEDLTVNCEHCYVYKDYYYFASKENSEEFKEYTVQIKSSRRMQDGGYYAVCSVQGAAQDEIYVTAYKEQDEQGATSWNIISVKNEPVFDTLGYLIDYTVEGECSYEMKRVVLEGYLEDGETLFCEYVIEYPYFLGDTEGEVSVNTLFSSTVANYTLQSEDAQSLYKKYKKAGYDPDELPLQIYSKSQVTYNNDGKIAVKTVISESAKVILQTEQETTSSYYSYNYSYTLPEIESVTLGTKTVEGYTIDIETGEYITKDNFVGKDYLTTEELIYRIYSGYDYSTVLSGDEAYNYDTVPYDKEEIGKSFYENGASVLCEDGYMFFMPGDDGTLKEVVIPNDVLSQLTA